jgi:hypothetical protein
MPGETAYVIRLAGWLARALGGSAALFEEFITDDLGVELPPAVVEAPAVATALQQAAASANRAEDVGTTLESFSDSADEVEILAAFLALGTELGTYFTALDGLVDAVGAAVTPETVPDPAARATAQGFAGELVKRLADYVIASALTDEAPQFAFVLRLLGLLDWRRMPPPGGDELARDYVHRSLELQRFKLLISDPAEHYRQALGWGDESFDPEDIFRLARDFFGVEDDVDAGVDDGEPFLRIGELVIRRDSSVAPPGMLLSLIAEFDDDRSARVEMNDEWGAGLTSDLRMIGTISARLTPPLAVELQPPEGEIIGSLRAQLDRNEAAQPFDVVGGTGLMSLSADNAALGLGLDADWQITRGTASIDPLVFAQIDGLTLVLGTSDADSFVASLLAGAEVKGEFDLGLEWRATTGLRVTASGGVEVAVPIHSRLGPVELDTIYLALRILENGTLSLETSSALSGRLGPLTAAVDRLGTTLDLRFVEGADARYGPFDLALRFKPPNGIGIAVDAVAVKGGGYLSIDAARGQYAGALELVVGDFLMLNAVGLVTTRNPDGSPGFSLVALISADFGAGIQLGYGFKLLAVGGLFGLNRTVRLEALVEGVKSGAIEHVMFPRDVVENAPRIITDLQAFFPQQDDRFLIGPMAKIGWGAPTLVSLALAVVIEIPGDITIAGILRIALPDEELAIVVIQVNFVGAIELDRGRVYFFAALYDSHLLGLTLEGEMAALATFGDEPDFVLSVGGFHPRFEPPPLPVPTPRRIAIDILNQPNAKLRAEGYLAVTTNTAQFGARADAFFGFDAFSIEGSLAFDALLQFSPLHFVADISCSFSLKAFGAGVFAIRVQLALEGPTPWRARGTGSLKVLFLEISVDFDITWGEDRPAPLPPIEVMPVLTQELSRDANWQAELPPGSTLLVSVRPHDSEDPALVVHPVGTLRVSQRAVPLELSIDKVGNQPVSDARRFSLTADGGGLVKRDDAAEKFAPAQFREFSDADKLSLPAFEPVPGGIELSVAGVQRASGPAIERANRYELITIDSEGDSARRGLHTPPSGLEAHFARGASAARSPLSRAARDKLTPFADRVTVTGERFVVARQADSTAQAPAFASEALARDHLARELERDASLAGSLHVIPEFEAVG